MMNDKKIPLALMVEETQKRMKNSMYQIMDETKLPPFLIEGILNELLAEVRQKQYFDLSTQLAKVLLEQEKAEPPEPNSEVIESNA